MLVLLAYTNTVMIENFIWIYNQWEHELQTIAYYALHSFFVRTILWKNTRLIFAQNLRTN